MITSRIVLDILNTRKPIPSMRMPHSNINPSFILIRNASLVRQPSHTVHLTLRDKHIRFPLPRRVDEVDDLDTISWT
jgi:hypothetical protein